MKNKNSIKYFKITIFVLAALSIIDFMRATGLNSAGRFYFHYFEAGRVLRGWTDLILLISLIVLILNYLTHKKHKLLYWPASFAYILFISPDISEWLWLTLESRLYYVILTVHTLPIIVILSEQIHKVSMNRFFIVGISLMIIGFIYGIIFIKVLPSDATFEIIETQIRNQKISFWLYYTGLISVVLGLMKFMNSIVKHPIVVNGDRP